jgi:hypothetical protein
MQNNNHNRNNNPNPFSAQHPVQPLCFADRTEELQYFTTTARNSAILDPPAPLNYAILGSWGQGKTSLLYKFRQIALEELAKDMKCVSIYFPLSPTTCQNWGVFSDSFLRTVKTQTSATKGFFPKIADEMKKWEMSLNIGPVTAQRKVDQEPPNIIDALQSLWDNHLRPSKVDIAFVLLDDLHYFPIKAEEPAYLTLRTTFQELVNRGCNYSLIVTAPSLLFSAIAEIAEPVVRFFKRFDLKPFTVDETKEAVAVRLRVAKSRLKIDEDVIETIAERTQGHPTLVMFAMQELLIHAEKHRHIDASVLTSCWPFIEDSMGKSIFEQKYQNASEKERELMIMISETQKSSVAPVDFKERGIATELFSRLEKKELLIRQGRGKYSLFHPMFADYLRKQ